MKVPHRLIAAAAAVALGGCTMMLKHTHTSTVEQELGSIMGADLSTAVGILGFPESRRELPGRTVYAWSSNRAAGLPQTEIRVGSYAPAPASASAPADGCRVEISADNSGRVAGFELSGSDERCGWVLQAFQRAKREEQTK
jgi:hypothetical protein